MTSREIAQKVGISNGSAYYLLTSLIVKGFVKFNNFQNKYTNGKIYLPIDSKGYPQKIVT